MIPEIDKSFNVELLKVICNEKQKYCIFNIIMIMINLPRVHVKETINRKKGVFFHICSGDKWANYIRRYPRILKDDLISNMHPCNLDKCIESFRAMKENKIH